MRVVCKENEGKGLSAVHFGSGYTPETEFDLEVGKEYVAYGVLMWRGILAYLLLGEGGCPSWYPSAIFDITFNEVPRNWYFSQSQGMGDVEPEGIWGYEELVNVPYHFERLADLDEEALEIFFVRKKESDNGAEL